MHAILALGVGLTTGFAIGRWNTEAPDVASLKSLACSMYPPSDKFNGNGYELMYGTMLMPLAQLAKPRIFEIGLGCDMVYGPGASAKLWRKALPHAEIWEADVNANCIEAHKKALGELGITPLVGDQANSSHVRRWLKEVSGNFDVIIDDGAHTNGAILKTLKALWPKLSRGGRYFIEDMCVGRRQPWNDGHPLPADVLSYWMNQLIMIDHNKMHHIAHSVQLNHNRTLRGGFPAMPKDVAFIFCSDCACVIGKDSGRGHRHVSMGGTRCPNIEGCRQDSGGVCNKAG